MLLGLIPVWLLISLLKKLDKTLQPLPIFRKRAAQQRKNNVSLLAVWLIGLVFIFILLAAVGLPSFNLVSDLKRYLPANLVILVATLALSFVIYLVYLSGIAESSRGLLVFSSYLLLTTSQALHAQYLLSRQTNLANTVLPTPLSQWLQPGSLLLLVLISLIIYNLGIRAGIKGLLPGMAGISALYTGTQAFGAFVPHFIHTNIPTQYTYGLLLRQGITALSDQAINDSLNNYALIYSLVVLICAILALIAAWLMKVCLMRVMTAHR